jgi:hypothetical protein
MVGHSQRLFSFSEPKSLDLIDVKRLCIH